MSPYQEIISEINLKYEVSIQSAAKANRIDSGNSNTLLQLIGDEHSYFFKTIPAHSLREELDQIYSELSLVKPHSFKLALPIKSKSNVFCENILGNPSSVYPFVSHRVFDETDIPVDRINRCLMEFHGLIRPLGIPSHPFKTYENWFERGLQQLKNRTKEHPLLVRFEEFIQNRFRNFRFVSGNTHFDLNPFNVWVSTENDIYLSDFDNAQPAALAKDYFDIMSRYLRIDKGVSAIPTDTLGVILSESERYVDGLRDKDAKYLLVRPKLGSLFDPSTRLEDEQIYEVLDGLLEFVSS